MEGYCIICFLQMQFNFSDIFELISAMSEIGIMHVPGDKQTLEEIHECTLDDKLFQDISKHTILRKQVNWNVNISVRTLLSHMKSQLVIFSVLFVK